MFETRVSDHPLLFYHASAYESSFSYATSSSYHQFFEFPRWLLARASTVPELLAEENENEFHSAITLFPNPANADVFPVGSSLNPTENMAAFAGYLPLKTNAMKTEIFHHTQFHVTY